MQETLSSHKQHGRWTHKGERQKGQPYNDWPYSGLEDKTSKAPLDNILSFESKILKGLGKKEKNIEDQSDIKKDLNVSNKIKPLQLFDNVVKKLTSNHQQSSDQVLTQNNVDEIANDISLDRIRDTYQRIFSEYK